jgi:hypothetical protein
VLGLHDLPKGVLKSEHDKSLFSEYGATPGERAQAGTGRQGARRGGAGAGRDPGFGPCALNAIGPGWAAGDWRWLTRCACRPVPFAPTQTNCARCERRASETPAASCASTTEGCCSTWSRLMADWRELVLAHGVTHRDDCSLALARVADSSLERCAAVGATLALAVRCATQAAMAGGAMAISRVGWRDSPLGGARAAGRNDA